MVLVRHEKVFHFNFHLKMGKVSRDRILFCLCGDCGTSPRALCILHSTLADASVPSGVYCYGA